MERKRENGKHFRKRHKKKNYDKYIIKFLYWAFIISCLIISIWCLFKHGKQVKENNIIYTTYLEGNIQETIGKIENGEVVINQNIPIPQELKEKMAKEQAEKKAEEERKIAEQKALEEQKKLEAEKKAEEERQKQQEEKKKQEEIRLAQTKQVTSRGGSTIRQETSNKTTSKTEYQAYAKDLCLNSYGWTENDFNCLVKLVNKESNWNPNAVNKSSGATGLFQALPASKMASEGSDYMTNYKTQIKWGLKYIKNRYGNPASAWSHSQKKGWY